MKTKLVIPIERFDILLHHCNPAAPQYRLLRDSLIAHNDRGQSAEILCDSEEAESILVLARQIERATRSI